MASGKCGENLTWIINDGILMISGTGYMYNSFGKEAPWWYYQKSSINKVVINNGITSIAGMAFWELENLKEVILPDSVKEIGNRVFYCCTNLERIYYKAGSEFADELSVGNNAELFPY